jgi:hypothetical protein
MNDESLIAKIHGVSDSRPSGLRQWLLIWLPCTIVLDLLQFLFFDCSRLPLLSILFGLPAFGAAVALPIVLFETWTTQSASTLAKTVKSVLAVVLLTAIVCLAGVAVLLSHICS